MAGSLLQEWKHSLQTFLWQACHIQSHALALFVIYFAYHYPWGWQNRDPLLRPPPNDKQDSKSGSVNSQPRGGADESICSSPSKELSASLASLSEACPSSTAAERKRFLVAREGNLKGATNTLQHFLAWHQKHVKVAQEHGLKRLVTEDEDLDIWNEACQIALKASGEATSLALPRVIRTHRGEKGKTVADLSGHRLFQIIPAQMDVSIASGSTYALAVAIYLNNSLDREGEEKIVVCMDVRAGRGWPNTHVMRLIPFMQQTTTLLLSLFPERLHRCYVYPVPPSFLWIWNAISKVVDPLTRDKICLMTGPNRIESPPPFEQMYQHLPKSAAHHLEDTRLASFTNQ